MGQHQRLRTKAGCQISAFVWVCERSSQLALRSGVKFATLGNFLALWTGFHAEATISMSFIWFHVAFPIYAAPLT